MQWIKFSRVMMYAACIFLAACGSEKDDDEVASIIDGSGAPVPDVAVSGAITGFGSVIVNGVHYETDSAEVYINGELSSEEALSIGDFITLFANENDDELDVSVIYAESAVLGKVSGINYADGTIDVVNQRVRISGDTVFDANFAVSNISDISVGDTVEVRGASAGSGNIYATRINKGDSNTDLISGRIASLDTSAQTFMLSGNTVEYSQATLNFSLSDSQWVSVVGTLSAQTGSFIAQSIRERQDRQPLTEGTASRLEGLIENVSQTGFDINGQRVKLLVDTQYRDGSAFDLLEGAVVVVEGDVDAQGQLQANVIRFRDSNFITVDGLVEDIDPVGVAPGEIGYDPFYWGTVSADGETFIVNAYTIFVGRGPEFGFRGAWYGDLRLGDQVHIVAAGLPGSGDWVARVVEFERMEPFGPGPGAN